jgi:dihydrofolate synthase/folylpolyglutamate synthase
MGKGSVSALLETAMLRAGYRVGRYSSPHLQQVTERVSIGQNAADESILAYALSTALDVYEDARRDDSVAAAATWFAVVTAAAFISF